MRSDAPIYVITGERGSGKTTVCARVARGAHERGLRVAGILTERGDDADPGSARRVVDLRSGEARPFGAQDRGCACDPGREAGAAASSDGGAASVDTASVDTAAVDAASADAAGYDPLTPGWEFDSGVFAWANDVLTRSLPCDLLVVDEVGPLELLGDRGWAGALAVLESGEYRAAMVVCRPGLLNALRERLPGSAYAVVEVTPKNRDALPAALVEELLRSVGGA
ncbi:MAG: nucleoside-triphosphatase [Actinomycetia bacterium]|nr:nucleoside-triphosphatase [Actinomycetes bacterium]